MTPEIIKYKADHVLDLGPCSKEDIDWAVTRERASVVAFSAMLDGKCIGCAGVGKMYGSVYLVWAEFGPDVKRYPLWLHKTAKRYFGALLKTLPWQRMEAVVIANMERNCRWIESLGFRPQSANGVPCLELKVGPHGENCLRYFMVR